jgi:cytochrome c biogenesis protein CcmG, thiol:disulfide interchange protein DsbE
MKKLFVLPFLLLFSIAINAQDNSGRKLPNVELKKLDGSKINIQGIKNDGKPMVINFWATWCAPCKRELNTIAEVYDQWKEETGVKIIAVSIDDVRNESRVKPYVDGVSWDYEVLLDVNQDLKRAMNVNNVPHTFLIDGEGNIVWQHNNYAPGDEEELLVEIKKLTTQK